MVSWCRTPWKTSDGTRFWWHIMRRRRETRIGTHGLLVANRQPNGASAHRRRPSPCDRVYRVYSVVSPWHRHRNAPLEQQGPMRRGRECFRMLAARHGSRRYGHDRRRFESLYYYTNRDISVEQHYWQLFLLLLLLYPFLRDAIVERRESSTSSKKRPSLRRFWTNSITGSQPPTVSCCAVIAVRLRRAQHVRQPISDLWFMNDSVINYHCGNIVMNGKIVPSIL